MQELAETGARLAAPPVPAAGLVLGHQARGLQGLRDERIAEAHAMLAPGELVEMPDVEPQIPLAIEREQALHLGDRGALGPGGLRPDALGPGPSGPKLHAIECKNTVARQCAPLSGPSMSLRSTCGT